MLSLVWQNMRRRKARLALLILGIALLSTGLSYLSVLVNTTRTAVDQSLGQHWRTSYDILVRPAGSAISLEQNYQIIEANHLSGLQGAITPEQLETIRSIPGVKVAAPIGMLGYISLASMIDLQPPTAPGLYRLQTEITTSDGMRTLATRQTAFQVYYPHPLTHDNFQRIGQTTDWSALRKEFGITPMPVVTPTPDAKGKGSLFYWRMSYSYPVLLAAVDPQAEAELVGLDGAIVDGRYLTPEDVASREPSTKLNITRIPVLMSNRAFSEVRWHGGCELILPGELDPAEILARLRQGQIAPATMSGTPACDVQLDTAALLSRLKQTLTNRDPQRINAWRMRALSSPLTYQEIASPDAGQWPLVLEIAPVGAADRTVFPDSAGSYEETARVAYRTQGEFQGETLLFDLVGEYDPAHLKNVETDGQNAVPMETYRPVTGVLRYLPDGTPIAPRRLDPTDSPQDAFLSPPVLVTTMQAAQSILHRDGVISAVRVRVEGVDEISEAAQAKVQLIADEIRRRTDLQVDITLGSSPRRVLTQIPGYQDLPGIGYVEQAWVQKGAQILIHREVDKGNALLLIAVLVVGVVYVLTTATVSVLSRRRELALLAAVGWRRGQILRSVMTEGTLAAVMAAAIGMAVTWFIGIRGQLYMPPDRILFSGALTALVYFLGVLGPAVTASRTRPMTLLREGEMGRVSGHIRVTSLWMLALANLIARWRRNLLSVLAIAIPTALLAVLAFITLRLRGIFVLTVLGEALVLQVGPVHLWTLSITFAIAILTVADVLWLNISERVPELALVAALGWRRGTVRTAILLEGALLGATAGVAGLGTGLGIMSANFSQSMLELLPIAGALLLVPIGTGVAGALLPAEVGARVAPAAGLRDE